MRTDLDEAGLWMSVGTVLIVPVQWENPYTVGDTILRPGILSHARGEKAG